MSRLRLSIPLSDASAAVADARAQVGSRYWPGDLVEATRPLRLITDCTIGLAIRLHAVAEQIATEEGADYTRAVHEAAIALLAPTASIAEQSRPILSAWDQVASHHQDTLAAYTPRNSISGLAAPLSTASAGMVAAQRTAGGASGRQLWPIDWIRASDQLRFIAGNLGMLTANLADVLSVGGPPQSAMPSVEETRRILHRIRARYRAIASDWLNTHGPLETIEAVRKTQPAPQDGSPAIGM